jgi:hypothetical protein
MPISLIKKRAAWDPGIRPKKTTTTRKRWGYLQPMVITLAQLGLPTLSLFILAMTVRNNDSRRLNTLLFLSNQISQRINKARERVAFRGIFGVVVMFVHH